MNTTPLMSDVPVTKKEPLPKNCPLTLIPLAVVDAGRKAELVALSDCMTPEPATN